MSILLDGFDKECPKCDNASMFAKKIYKRLNFTIYEDESVTSDGKLYYTPGRMHYYFNFGNDISKIYRDDELNLLMNEIHTKLSKRMGVDELRNIKLIDMGI